MTRQSKCASLLTLHDDLMTNVLSWLDNPRDLAALSSQVKASEQHFKLFDLGLSTMMCCTVLQCQQLRLLVHDSPAWQCQRRWTSYGIPWDLVADYGWAETYRQLDALPDQVVQGVGRSHQMNSNWNELEIDMNQNVHNTGTVSEEFSMAMEAVCHLGILAAVKDAQVLDSYAAAVLRRDLHPWLSEEPHIVYMFGANLRELMYVKPYKYPDCEDEVMDELAWRRSAVEFLPQLLARGTDPSQYAGLLRRLACKAAGFDAWLHEQLLVGGDRYNRGVGSPSPPPGIWWGTIDILPESHWWWRVTPAPGHDSDSDSYGDSDSDSA